MRLRPVRLLFLVLLCSGCEVSSFLPQADVTWGGDAVTLPDVVDPEDGTTPRDPGPLPVDVPTGPDTGWPDPPPVPDGTPCPHGVQVCGWDQACSDNACGPCTNPKDCRPMQGCLPSGRCGDCGTDADCQAGRTCRRGYCLPAALTVWSLTLAPTDLQTLINNPYDTTMVPCSLTVDGEAYAGCEVRIHGGASRDYPKKSFRIELPKGAPDPGYSRKMTLRAEYNDASMLRNFLAHEVFRRTTNVPTPRTRHVRLSLNGADYGVMLLIERIGSDFLEHRGRDPEAPMYEADPPTDLMRLGAGSFIPLPDAATYQATYDKKTGPDGDWSDVVALIEGVVWQDWLASTSRLIASTARIRNVLAVDRYLEYLAAMGVLQNHDHVRKNYYLSKQRDAQGTARWEFYPSDLDMSFGCLWTEAHETLCIDTFTQDAWDRGVLADAPAGYPVQAFYNQLVQQVLRDPEFTPRFEGRICRTIAGPFWTDGLPRLIDAMEETLAPEMATDPKDRNADAAAWRAQVQEVRRFVAERTAFLENGLGCP